jgi:hypothetical protein
LSRGSPKKHPQLVRLKYGTIYCELCTQTLTAGDPVAWWQVVSTGGRRRPAVYCADCHRANVRAGAALRSRTSGSNDLSLSNPSVPDR